MKLTRKVVAMLIVISTIIIAIILFLITMLVKPADEQKIELQSEGVDTIENINWSDIHNEHYRTFKLEDTVELTASSAQTLVMNKLQEKGIEPIWIYTYTRADILEMDVVSLLCEKYKDNLVYYVECSDNSGTIYSAVFLENNDMIIDF